MFIQFDTVEAREEFLAEVSKLRPGLSARLREGAALPHVVAGGLSDDEAGWLRQQAKGRGRVFENVQFERFAPEAGREG